MTSSRLLRVSIIVIIVAIGAIVHESHQQDVTNLPDIEGYRLHCIEASGITESAAKKLQSGVEIAHPDQATKCYVQCFFQRLALMNKVGVVQKGKLIKFLTKVMEEEQAKSIVDKCDARRTNPCDTAYDMFICYRQNKAKLL
ncbi:general odorant-binding protein 56d-like [Toxorhynchites rutilus septentrionalis]|uniref:general odorant-binding protein 56d-like n=1 Tax=Toxorhynchites rutilus septentrionalis TaxID=329112 RepID=UPI00247A4F1A|nr:general odorant-binding protein 56d-like [Toxorhynchites rutilus septentrionalis]